MLPQLASFTKTQIDSTLNSQCLLACLTEINQMLLDMARTAAEQPAHIHLAQHTLRDETTRRWRPAEERTRGAHAQTCAWDPAAPPLGAQLADRPIKSFRSSDSAVICGWLPQANTGYT